MKPSIIPSAIAMHDIISCQVVLLWRVSVSAHDLKGNTLIVEFDWFLYKLVE